MQEASALYRLLGDEARLRLLRVLDQDRFNVKELTGILGLAQSGVSRHLGLLKDAGLVVEERDGAFTFYRLAPGVRDDAHGPAVAAAAKRSSLAAAGSPRSRPTRPGCRKCCGCAAKTSSTCRPRHARRPAAGAGHAVGRRGRAPSACCCRRSTWPTSAAAKAISTVETARWAQRVVAVDRSTGVLARAKALAARKRLTQHHLEEGRARAAADRRRRRWTWRCCRRRCTTPATRRGRWPRRRAFSSPAAALLILDLRSHDETWVREKLGDQWFGFTDDHLAGVAHRGPASRRPRRRSARARTNDPFAVLLAIGTKPRKARKTKR